MRKGVREMTMRILIGMIMGLKSVCVFAAENPTIELKSPVFEVKHEAFTTLKDLKETIK